MCGTHLLDAACLHYIKGFWMTVCFSITELKFSSLALSISLGAFSSLERSCCRPSFPLAMFSTTLDYKYYTTKSTKIQAGKFLFAQYTYFIEQCLALSPEGDPQWHAETLQSEQFKGIGET